MSPAEQSAAWNDLVAWVVWIHDQYELSREERLPLCWPQHPGLVEELRSLKTWRERLYGTPDAISAPHSPRSWHGELRQTITAALTFWAPGCRTGHVDACLLADAQPEALTGWLQAGPPVMDSAPDPVPPARSGPAGGDEISAQTMRDALTTGQAEHHSRGIPHFAHYRDAWWTRSADGTTWIRVDDPDLIAHLERTSRQLRAADTASDQHTDSEDH